LEGTLQFQERETVELKPVDGGRDAWTVLIAGIAVEALFWGMHDFERLRGRLGN